MQRSAPRNHGSAPGGKPPQPPLFVRLLGIACLLLVLIGIVWPRHRSQPPPSPAPVASSRPPSSTADGPLSLTPHHHSSAGQKTTAEQIVADKLARFARNRCELTHKLADHFKLAVPADVDRYFDALEAGRWNEAKAIYKSIGPNGPNWSPPGSDDLHKFWRPILESYGAAEQAQLWPAQQLLDYGNSILGALPPGMVYVGGTDSGCFIPTMLNATTDGEQHVTLTQNALADGTYLDYLSFLYGNQLNTLTQDDSQQAFQQYLDGAKQRLEHDQQFPDEPKQILQGEDVTLDSSTGKLNVSGQTAVMAVNELLLQNLLQKNPDLSFGMEESFPLKSTYVGGQPLGPIYQLQGGATQSAMTPDSAASAVSYWQNTAQQLLSDPDASQSAAAMNSYSHDIAAQGNLLANNSYPDQAEQDYQLALSLCPTNTEALGELASFLASQGKLAEANQTLDQFVQSNPDTITAINTLRKNLPAPQPKPAP